MYLFDSSCYQIFNLIKMFTSGLLALEFWIWCLLQCRKLLLIETRIKTNNNNSEYGDWTHHLPICMASSWSEWLGVGSKMDPHRKKFTPSPFSGRSIFYITSLLQNNKQITITNDYFYTYSLTSVALEVLVVVDTEGSASTSSS